MELNKLNSKLEQIQRIKESGVVAVVRKVPIEKVELVARSLISGGVTAIEITLDDPDALVAIEKVSKYFSDRAIIGAGTVMDPDSVLEAIQAGAEFIVSPHFNPEVVRETLQNGKVSIPGVFTPTEMIRAMDMGADVVKVFPASSLGPQFIKDVMGPFPDVSIIPTGGINLENVSSYIKAGALSVGVGGNLVDKNAIEVLNFEAITRTAKQFVERVKEARKEGKS